MKCIVSIACVLSVLIAASLAAPYPASGFSASGNLQVGGSGSSTGVSTTNGGGAGGGAGGLSNILSTIDLPGLLRGVNSFVKLVGAFCPPLSQVLDNVIQNVTSTAFRVFGRLILQGGGLGGGGGSSSSSGGSGSKVNVVLPTFPPDDYDEDEEEEEETASTEVSKPGESEAIDLRISMKGTTTENVETTRSAVNTASQLYTSPSNEENTIAKRHVRVVRETGAEAEEEADQDGAESAPQPAQDLANVDVDDADRNKRFLPFGGGDGHGGGAGGSGNFLFDIIRNTADRAARTVGTVYRMVAGTESLGWGLTGTAETTRTIPSSAAAKLVAGSGATEETDEKAHAPGGIAEIDIAPKGAHDGYTEGIPGPITRLFVLANRGIANLVQDLILGVSRSSAYVRHKTFQRLAQTSERLVNFKARLVTSLI